MASGETIIIFGNMTFFNVLTRYVNQEFVTEDTGTDVIGIKFNISVVAFIHGLASAGLGTLPTLGDGDAANNLAQLRYLMGNQQHFEYRCGAKLDNLGNIVNRGTALLVCDPANQIGSTNVSLRDINNGPKCQVMNVTRVASDSLLKVELEFEIWQTQCAPDGTTQNKTGVFNNRWTVVDDIDQNFYTTRTFTGKLRLSSSQCNPHNFRYLCVPPLQQGMRRDHMHFEAQADGLALLYTITDKEVAFAPPAPATSWAASFGQRVDYNVSLGHFYDATITLAGDRNCDLKKLIAIASSMALSKFSNGVKVAQDNSYRVLNIEVIEEYGNEGAAIHLRSTAQRVDTEGSANISLNTKFLGVPITGSKIADVADSYDYRLSRDGRPGEMLEVNGPISLIGAFASFLQSGCGINFGINLGIPAQVQQPQPGVGSATVSAVTVSEIKDDQTIKTVYSNANNDGMYTYSVIQDDEDVDSGSIQMPLGVADPGPPPDGYVPGGPQAQNPTSVRVDLMPPTSSHLTIIDQERIGKPPARPKINTAPGITITKVQRKSLTPSSTPDGKKIHRNKTLIWWFDATRPNLPTDNAGNLFRRLPITFVDTDVITNAPNSNPPVYNGGF